MALASASGTPFDKNTVKNDGGAVLNIGDSDKFGNLNIAKASSSPKNTSGAVERDGDVGSTSDRAGVQKANSSQPFAKAPESNLIFGAGVNDKLNSRDYSGSLDNDATDAARGILRTSAAGSGALAGFDMLARPDAEISTGRTRPANAGRAVRFIDPETGADATISGIKPTRGNPSKLRWTFGGLPQRIRYARKDAAEGAVSSVSSPTPAPAPDPVPQAPTWTSNYDTAEFSIVPKNLLGMGTNVSLGLESIGYKYGSDPNRDVFYDRVTDDSDFEIQIDWGDGTTSTASASNIAAQNHQYPDESARTITITSSGNAWPDWHQLARSNSAGGYIAGYYDSMVFHEPPGTKDTYVGVPFVESITSWGGLFTGSAGRIGGAGSLSDFWDGTVSGGGTVNPPYERYISPGLRADRQIKFNNNTAGVTPPPDTGFVLPDHVPNTTSLDYLFYGIWDNTSWFRDSQGNALNIPALETENFGNSVYQITSLRGTFERCIRFIPDISRWRTDNVTDMYRLFYICTFAPSRDLSGWNTANVTNFQQMFRSYQSFNADISSWDTSSATNMRGMFMAANSFNQNIGSWNTSSVTDMQEMFWQASVFNQDISGWDFSSVTNLTNFLREATSFSQAYYDALLIRWAEQADVAGGILQNITTRVDANYTLGGAAEAARTSLVVDHGWTITDSGGA